MSEVKRSAKQLADLVELFQHRKRAPVNPAPLPSPLLPGRKGQWPFATPKGATKAERRKDALRIKQAAMDAKKAQDDAKAARLAALAKMERDSG